MGIGMPMSQSKMPRMNRPPVVRPIKRMFERIVP
jgi:hypothetical protein